MTENAQGSHAELSQSDAARLYAALLAISQLAIGETPPSILAKYAKEIASAAIAQVTQ